LNSLIVRLTMPTDQRASVLREILRRHELRELGARGP
jgi:hypothetical protein